MINKENRNKLEWNKSIPIRGNFIDTLQYSKNIEISLI